MKRVIWINVAIGFWLLIAAFTQHAGLMRGLKMANDLVTAMLLLPAPCGTSNHRAERSWAAFCWGAGSSSPPSC